MNKKILIIDLIVLICSLICCLIFNSSTNIGLTISQMMGYFAISFTVLIFCIVGLVIIIIGYSIKKYKNK